MIVTRVQAYMSHDNSVTQSTIRGWLKAEQKLHDFVDTVNSTDGMTRKIYTYFNSHTSDLLAKAKFF